LGTEFECGTEVQKAGIKVKPEVMIPLVGFKRELDLQVAVVHAAAMAVRAVKKVEPGAYDDRSPARRAYGRRDCSDRRARPGIKLGICGEHGGDPDSVKFCHKVGLTYVRCSPLHVPVARLVAAQAALEEEAAKAAKPAKKK
jgi:hypothetical protein